MSSLTCSACQYWRPGPHLPPGFGECRRHAPTYRAAGGRAQWGHTHADEDCGDRVPANPVPASGPVPTGKGPVGRAGVAEMTGAVMIKGEPRKAP